MLLLAPLPHQLRQRDAHRTDGLTPSAEGRGIGQMTRLVEPDQIGRERSADRARIDPAIGVAADGGIDRAGVHARAAFDAAQDLAELAVQDSRAPVVEQNDVERLGPIRIAGAARAGRERRIGAELLPRGRAREETQEGGRVIERGDHLLHGREHDVHLGQNLRELGIALIGDEDDRAGLRDQKVGARDAGAGREIARA